MVSSTSEVHTQIDFLSDSSWIKGVSDIEEQCVRSFNQKKINYNGSIVREVFGNVGSLSGLLGIFIATCNQEKSRVTLITGYGPTGIYAVSCYDNSTAFCSFPMLDCNPKYMGITTINTSTVEKIIECYSRLRNDDNIYRYLTCAFKSTNLGIASPVRALYDNLTCSLTCSEDKAVKSRCGW